MYNKEEEKNGKRKTKKSEKKFDANKRYVLNELKR